MRLAAARDGALVAYLIRYTVIARRPNWFAARFELKPETSGIKETWSNHTGGDTLWSDRRVAVIQLNDCETPEALPMPNAALDWRRRSRWTRFARAQILSIHDVWRSNVIYASFDLSRMFIRSMRDRSLQNRRIREYEARQ